MLKGEPDIICDKKQWHSGNLLLKFFRKYNHLRNGIAKITLYSDVEIRKSNTVYKIQLYLSKMLKSKFFDIFSSLPILFETNAVQIPLFGEFFALLFPDFRTLCHYMICNCFTSL